MALGHWRFASLIVSGLLLIAGGAAAQQPPAAAPVRPPGGSLDEGLRNELLLRVRADQAARQAFVLKQQTGGIMDSTDVARLSAVDTSNSHWLARVVERRGWPTRAQVGPDAVRGALLLVEHADLDTAFQARVLPLIQVSYAAGDLPGGDVAVLVDRVAINHGRPQVYGTQAKLVNGRWVAAPIADSASVDARRAKVGLRPLRDYFRILDSLSTAPE